MARWPPSILSVLPTSDGGVEVKWEVDTFFGDSEEPEKVLIDLNGLQFSQLDGDEDSVEVSRDQLVALGTQVVAISVTFWWSGPPSQELQSSVTVPVQTGGIGPGNSGVNPAAKPVVTVEHVQRRTVQSLSSIKIAWRSNNYNDGNIFWGPASAPRAFARNIRPVGENYQGTFTTDRALTAATVYVFTVEVRNTLHSPTWIATSVAVRSAADFLSVRQFLIASGTPLSASLRSIVGVGRSVRQLLLG